MAQRSEGCEFVPTQDQTSVAYRFEKYKKSVCSSVNLRSCASSIHWTFSIKTLGKQLSSYHAPRQDDLGVVSSSSTQDQNLVA